MVRITRLRKFLAALCLLVVIGANLPYATLQSFAPEKAAALPPTFSMVGTEAVRAFANANGANISTAWDGMGMVRLDPATLFHLCNLAGYSQVGTWSCYYPGENRCNFTSCGNNTLTGWNGTSWVTGGACGGAWIGQFSCTTPFTQCNDTKDNDGDGKVDLQDPGCTSATDDNEGDQPKFDVTKTLEGNAVVGGQAVYKITVKNIGTVAATNVNFGDFFITNTVPAAPTTNVPLTYVSADAPGGTCTPSADKKSVVCNYATINAGETKTAFLTFDVAATAACGSVVMNQVDVHLATGYVEGISDWDKIPATMQCLPACRDGRDNDNDGKIDMADPGCSNPDDTNEGDEPQCSDGKDNDADGRVDILDPGCHTDFDPLDGDNSYNPQDNNESDEPACKNNKDDDGDGKVDMADPGCSNPDDTNETDTPQCSDGIDNDQDGATDMSDFSCSSPTDNDETNPKAQCQDGIDNDNDGKIDFGSDPGCTSKQDNDEFNQPLPQCKDGIDNDNDGKIDMQDPGCSNPDDTNEGDEPQCSDGIDNDQDGRIDIQDPGCHTDNDPNDGDNSYNPNDNNEGDEPACRNNKDDDNDGKIDMQDPGCSNPDDTTETDTPQCSDGIDNDQDGATDMSDFSCSSPTDNDETNPKAQCQDGIDNDNDGKIDFGSDPGCTSKQDNDEFNQPLPQCKDGIDNDNDGKIDMQDPGCSTPDDNNESDDPALTTTLSIEKTTTQTTVQRNEPIIYTITVKNTGTVTATNVKVIDNIPFNLTFIPASSTASCALQNVNGVQQVHCQPITLTAGQTASVTLKFMVNANVACNSIIRNQADVDAANATFQWDDVTTTVSCPTVNQCSDGSDNDADGRIDFPLDPGCSSATDDNEGDEPQCKNNKDDDQDGKIDMNDPGCSSPDDNSESDNPQCSDGIDNDNDGRIDMLDPGCSSPTDNNESDEPACKNNKDDDNDGKVDMLDPGCSNPDDNNESDDPTYQCSNGIDDDQDGAIDAADFSCSGPTDNDETNPKAQCQDGVDNDNDGKIDFPLDPGCSSKQDNDEFNAATNVDLSIVKSTTSTTITRGNQIVYTITVQNTGGASATNVVVNDPIPTGLEFVTSNGASCAQNTATNIACTLGTMAAGSSRTFTLTFLVPNQTACTTMTINNQATVVASEGDSNTSNNTSSNVVTSVTCPVQQTGCIDIVKEAYDTNGNQIYTVPQFSFTLDGNRFGVNSATGNLRFNDVAVGTHTVIETVATGWSLQSVSPNNGTVNVQAGNSCAQVIFKNRQNSVATNNFDIRITDGETEVAPNDDVTYTVTVKNNQNVAVNNATVTVTLDDEVDFDECSKNCDDNGRFVTWTNLSFAANEQKTFTIDAEVEDDADDDLETKAQIFDRTDTDETDVDDDDVDSDNDDDTSSINLTKEASSSEVFPGGVVTYTLRIQNTGDTEIRNLVVKDRLPSGIVIIDNGNATSSNGNELTWNISKLAKGTTWTVSYRVNVDPSIQPGTILRNDVRVTASDINEMEGVTVAVIGNLPQTGYGSPTSASLIKLSPLKRSSSASLPIVVLISIIGLGTGAGMGVGRRFLTGF